MRTLTTDWSNSSYADAATFLDRRAGTFVTIPAATPVDSRSMADSVIGGDYVTFAYTLDTLTADSAGDAESVEEEASTDVVVTVKDNPIAMPNIRITATSADTDVFTVSPAYAVTDANGQATFTITGVAAGGPENLTFQVASDTSVEKVVAVTVTSP